MPNYEYECQKCGHHFEVFQKMTDPKLKQCPQCGGKVERLIGPGAGVMFKGSGFYQTDYRSDSYKQAAKAETGKSEGGKSEAGKGEAGKTESGKGGASKTDPGKSGTAKPKAAAKPNPRPKT
jgi:putative FmdB family regulatory protein